MLSPQKAAELLLMRRKARRKLAAYIEYTTPKYKSGFFSITVCEIIDQFLTDCFTGKRPILVLQAPPQHGKSEIVSRKLPPFVLGNYPDLRIATASYADSLAMSMAQDVRRNIASDEHVELFPSATEKKPYDINRMGEFSAPGGEGSYIGVGVGAGLTGRPADIGIIDDPIKGSQEALSQVTKESVWNWYQTVFKTRLSENSGQIIMATSWAQDDLAGRIIEMHKGDQRLKILRFPAINDPNESGYTAGLPHGALVPELHSLEQLRELKSEMSDYWWSAMYQQTPQILGGNVFKETGIRYYYPKDLPDKFDKVIASWDCTFKDTDGTDYVVGTVWGKRLANTYLLDLTRERMSFTKTVMAVVKQKEDWPNIREILIEDKANGPAVIDVLKNSVPGILPVEPDGSKLARAHAITSFWEAGNINLPHPDTKKWVKPYVNEMLAFPVAPHDDQVDSSTQAIRHLYPLFERLKISQEALNKALGR